MDLAEVEAEEERDEYVLAEDGQLWQGARAGQHSALPWSFAQFQVCLYLRRSRLQKDELCHRLSGRKSVLGSIVPPIGPVSG